MAHIAGWSIYIYAVECVYIAVKNFHANLDIQTYSSVITLPPLCFIFNIKFLFYLFIFHIGCINIQCNIYLFLLVYSIFRDGCFQLPCRATPGQRNVFSEMYMLTGPCWSWRDHADLICQCYISSIFIANSNLFVDMTCKNLK